jgi:hypothetical protein
LLLPPTLLPPLPFPPAFPEPLSVVSPQAAARETTVTVDNASVMRPSKEDGIIRR